MRGCAQALDVLCKLAASSDANLAELEGAGALDAMMALLTTAPAESRRALAAVHLLRNMALYSPLSR